VPVPHPVRHQGRETDMPQAPSQHWESVYQAKRTDEVSWFQDDPAQSTRLIEDAAAGDTDAAVIDVGGGASLLSSRLAERGFSDVTVLDLSSRALEASRAQDTTGTVAHLHADLLTWQPERRYRIWHDRAVFHFLTESTDRATYRNLLRRALTPDSVIILGTFAPDGPTHCSGLPVARYSAEDLAAELGDAFALTAADGESHHTPSGTVQPFTWITARLRPDQH
jgi:trans-aconitate methyltransferase